jgi:hypothetical protein
VQIGSIALLVLLIGAAPLNANARDASCNPDADEAQAMRTAPEGAKRLPGQHILVVNYKDGSTRFVDAPPYDEELSGLHWRYCGFVSAMKAHLIGMSKDSLFSGKLLLDSTGQLLDAGHSVYPSPDGKLFLAVEQEDGMDGELWTVSDLKGKKLWSGYAGTTKMQQPNGPLVARPYEAVQSTYESPRWTSQGQLQADQTCGNSPSKDVISFVPKNGSWGWSRGARCSK